MTPSTPANEASDGVSLREQLREMPFEFLHGVPVHLTEEMIDDIMSLIHDHDQRIIAEAERRARIEEVLFLRTYTGADKQLELALQTYFENRLRHLTAQQDVRK